MEFSDSFHETNIVVDGAKNGLTSADTPAALDAWAKHDHNSLDEVVTSVYILYEHTTSQRDEATDTIQQNFKYYEVEL